MGKGLSAIGDNGKSVDWWLIYKVPKGANAGGSKLATGYEYVYFDPSKKALAASAHLLSDASNALRLTLQQFPAKPSATTGIIYYNDEYPAAQKKTNNGDRGHCKGVLAFDTATDSALWLLHSTPRFTNPGSMDFPADELDYGQTFLCITLKDAKTADAIAVQMTQQQGPQVYGAHIPSGAAAQWNELAGAKFALSKTPSDVAFQSKKGTKFRSLAKSRTWGPDLWSDWVGPTLNVDLDVESWRRGTIPSTEDSNKKDTVEDITAIDMTPLGCPYSWPETKDHAKWATSLKGNDDWICVADINRQTSQSKRGGGAICFQNAALWKSLAEIDKVAGDKKKS